MAENIQNRVQQLNVQVVQLTQYGREKEAMDIALHAYQLATQYLGQDHLEFADSLNNLAILYQEMKDFEKAEPLLLQVKEIRRRVLGERHEMFAQAVHNLAAYYHAIGKHEQAEPLYQQSLELTRQTLGEGHPEFVTSLNNLGELYRTLGRYAEAEPLLKRAAEIARWILDPKHPHLAGILDNLGQLYESMGRYAEAVPLYRQAMEIRQEVLGENHPIYAATLSRLAGLYHLMGKYSEAEHLFHKEIAITRRTVGVEHLEFVKSLNNLSQLYLAVGRYAEAEKLLQQSLTISRRVCGEEHPDVAEILNNLGWLYYVMGRYPEAYTILNQTVEMKRKILGERHPNFAISLNNLAIVYQVMNRDTDAEPMLRQVVEIRREVLGSNHPDFAHSLYNLADVYQSMQRYTDAEPLLKEAIEVWRRTLGEKHFQFAMGLESLAKVYIHLQHDYTEAETLYKQAIEIKRQTLGEQHPDFSASLHALAALYSFVGEHDRAEPLLRQALEIKRTTLNTDHLNFAINLGNLAHVCAATRRIEEALTLMDQVIAIEDHLIGQVFSISSEDQRLAYLESNKIHFYQYLSLVSLHPSALAVQNAVNVVLRRKGITTEALAVQRDAVLGGRYPAIVPKLEALRTLREQIIQKTLAGPGHEGLSAHQKILSEWNVRKNQLEAELVQQIPEMNLEQQLRQVDRQVIANVLSEGGRLIEFVCFERYDFEAVAVWGEAPWKPAHYLAFVLPAREPDAVQMFDLGEAEPIDTMIVTFRDSILQEKERRGRNIKVQAKTVQIAGEDEGSTLRAHIFDPLLPMLQRCKRMFISPDGELTKLPFEILPTDDGRRVIDDYQFSYLGAGRDVLRFEQQSSGQPSASVIIADPDFDRGTSEEYPEQDTALLASTHSKRGLWSLIFQPSKPVPLTSASKESQQVSVPVMSMSPALNRHSRDFNQTAYFGRLPGTEAEGKRIAALIHVLPWTDEKALESSLKAYRSPRILHLATHGYFFADQKRDLNKMMQKPGDVPGSLSFGRVLVANLENPLLRSGLAFAGANTWIQGGSLPSEAEDGVLTAEDVMGLDLLDTELVVLSACDTGLGDVKIGEGVFGLRRSFVVAGAKTLVMSLWKVPDQQTQELMVEFYQRLLNGEPRAEALRQAQLTMKAKYHHPYYWGAFICQGDPDPLQSAMS